MPLNDTRKRQIQKEARRDGSSHGGEKIWGPSAQGCRNAGAHVDSRAALGWCKHLEILWGLMDRQNASGYEPLRGRGKESSVPAHRLQCRDEMKGGRRLLPSCAKQILNAHLVLLSPTWFKSQSHLFPDQGSLSRGFSTNTTAWIMNMGRKMLLKLDCLTPAPHQWVRSNSRLVRFLSPTKWISFALGSDSSAASMAVATWQGAWGALWPVTLLWHASNSGLAGQTDLCFTLRGQESKLKGSAKPCRQSKSSDHLL